jgi:hypothetical protein
LSLLSLRLGGDHMSFEVPYLAIKVSWFVCLVGDIISLD